jgi:predicted nucleic acid-binding protein
MISAVVSDTGPLISFEKIEGGFSLLRRMVGSVLIPPHVYMELAAGFQADRSYFDHYGIADLVRIVEAPLPPAAADGLDEGERYAISLALSQGIPLLIEERQGREVARQIGIHTSGSIGLLLAAWQDRLISTEEAEAAFQGLFRAGRINRTLLDMSLSRILGH